MIKIIWLLTNAKDGLSFFSKTTFYKKPNFSDYLFPRNLTPCSPRTQSKDLDFPFLLHPSKPGKKTTPKPKPLLRAVASASMRENICRSYLLPCCGSNFILAGLDHFIFRRCKHLWLKPRVSSDAAPRMSSRHSHRFRAPSLLCPTVFLKYVLTN